MTGVGSDKGGLNEVETEAAGGEGELGAALGSEGLLVMVLETSAFAEELLGSITGTRAP